MGVSPVGEGNAAAQAATTSASAKKLLLPIPSTSGAKKDAVLISQKAKDLAATKAGKAFQEEASESMSAKLQEAPGS